MKVILEGRNLSYTYPGNIRAIKEANIRILENKVTAILGPNGSGKTTLLLLLAGLLKPEKGEVLLDGENIHENLNKARKRIGIVFQDPDDQLFNLRVRDELAYGLKQLNLDRDEIEERVRGFAKKFRITHLLDRSPFSLSFGEKKMVLTAAILITNPDILIFDEPLSNLSGENKKMIYNIIEEYISDGKTVVFATNDSIAALELSDYFYVLFNGQTVYNGDISKLISDGKILDQYGVENPINTCSRILNKR